jgi:hypothetical protein
MSKTSPEVLAEIIASSKARVLPIPRTFIPPKVCPALETIHVYTLKLMGIPTWFIASFVLGKSKNYVREQLKAMGYKHKPAIKIKRKLILRQTKV